MKNIRKTRAECYHQIKLNGLLSKMRFLIFEAVYNNEGSTAREIFNKCNLNTNQSGRFTELRELGVIYEKGVKICSITGKKAISWGLTDKLPNKNKILFDDTKKPNNYNKCVKYIVRNMCRKNLMFITVEELNEL